MSYASTCAHACKEILISLGWFYNLGLKHVACLPRACSYEKRKENLKAKLATLMEGEDEE